MLAIPERIDDLDVAFQSEKDQVVSGDCHQTPVKTIGEPHPADQVIDPTRTHREIWFYELYLFKYSFKCPYSPDRK